MLQKERNFPTDPVDIKSKSGQQFLESLTFHIMKELFEANQHLKNVKMHRVTEINDVDRDAYLEEMVDVLHLYFESLMFAGITLDELVDVYLEKGRTNVERITSGY